MRAWAIGVLAAAALGFGGASQGQPAAAAPPPPYNPLETFAPYPMPTPVNVYRSSNGAPGPGYWQNRADYQITARLDAEKRALAGDELITYTNNSPDVLDVLWLQLDQNTYRRDSRSGALGARPRTQFTEGDLIDAVEVGSPGHYTPVQYVISDTRMQVRLPTPLRHGGKLGLHIRWHYAEPGVFGGRTAWVGTKNGDLYDMAQWFPRMAVYDDVRGWDTLPYLGSEFYCEYGTIDYEVTVPADMIVAGSGELMNPEAVLSATQLARLEAARHSDRTVMIRTPEEAAAAGAITTPTYETKTWRFRMENTRDVAFSASKAFVWDAARINLPGGKTALAQSLYPAEDGGDAAWGRSTEYLKFAVEEFSRRWYPYPWANAINVGGPVGGMEYPGLLFDSMADKGKSLFYLTVHEIGHSYFPMIVGTNERRYAWMDEGFNTFIDTYESDAFQGGVYGPKRDAEFAPGKGTPGEQIADLIADPAAPPIMTRADLMPGRYGHPIFYFKTAYGLILLREDIMGPERFDDAFRKFMRDWAYRHPQPADFFRAMESEGGEDLSWFWRGWFENNWSLDLAVDGVSYVGNDPAKGAMVALSNRGQLVLPAKLRLTFADGQVRDIPVPQETWMQSGKHVVSVDSTVALTGAVIDPDHRLPDRDWSNNGWKAP